MEHTVDGTIGEAQGRELRAAYEVLGTDAEANDVQPFFAAQSEVVGVGAAEHRRTETSKHGNQA
jgi:hypothetical protein